MAMCDVKTTTETETIIKKVEQIVDNPSQDKDVNENTSEK